MSEKQSLKLNLVVVLIMATLVALVWYWFKLSGSQNTTARNGNGFVPIVTLAKAERTPWADMYESLGTLVANESVTLTAKVTETVRAVNFSDGNYVERGAILVELTDAEESAQLAEARANLDDSVAQLKRIESLRGTSSVAESVLDEARARAASNQARLNAILARMSDRVIRAPFSGVLGFRQVSPGALVSPGTAIATLDDVSVVKLDFSLPEVFLSSIQSGDSIVAQTGVWPEREFRGSVSNIDSRINPVTRAVAVRALINNEDRALRPGMLMTLNLISREQDALVIPEQSLVQSQDTFSVYVLNPDDTVSRRAVSIGSRRRGLVEIRSGLEEGEVVIEKGVAQLREGSKVRYEQTQPRRGDSTSVEPVSRVEGSYVPAEGAGLDPKLVRGQMPRTEPRA